VEKAGPADAQSFQTQFAQMERDEIMHEVFEETERKKCRQLE